MTLDESKNEDDTVEELKGIRFLLDESLSKHLQAVNIDFTRSIMGEGKFSISGY